MAEEFAGLLPMNAMMGWNEGVESKNDAIELAKGFISRRYTAVEASWYAVAPFMGGYLWEVHEGGPGKGYIGSAIEALSQNPSAKFWFPSADRAFQIMMRDGKPFGILLSKSESLPVINSGQPPLALVTKMVPAVKKGTATFMSGAALLGSSMAFLAASMAFYAVAANPGPSLRTVDFSELPHAQWNRVSGTGVEEIVSKLEMKDGKWNVEKRAFVVPGLKEIRDDGQKIIQKAREGIMPMPDVGVDEPPVPPVVPPQPAAPGNSGPAPVASPVPAAATTTAPAVHLPAAPAAAIKPEHGGMSPAEIRRSMRGAAKANESPQTVPAPPAGKPPAAIPVPVDKGGRQ